MNHHEETISDAVALKSYRPVFVHKHPSGDWRTTKTLPRDKTYYTVLPSCEVLLNCPDDPKPIRIAPPTRNLPDL